MIGQTLGHYKILEKIGAGGMGEVYRAHDERLDRDVALKILPAGSLTDETARKRFRKEALMLARLNHPHIAGVYDFDSQGGVDFLAMEYVLGATLADKLKGGALEEKEVVRLGTQVAAALEAAHEERVIHRDLKPANIIVTAKGQAKVLDFGLAKLLRRPHELELTASLTEAPAAAGTLPYMAPEQLRGEPADTRTDLYAFGMVLYEMATAQRPFRERLGAQLISSILNEVPPPPSTLRRVSPGLENVILKCLDKEPARRYQSATELRVDLERLSGVSSAAAGTAVLRSAGSHRWRVVLPMAAAVLALVSTGVYFINGRGAAIDSLAVLPFENPSGNPDSEYLSDGITESLINSLSQLPHLSVMSRSAIFRMRGKDPQTAGRELGVRAVLAGRLVQRGDNLVVSAELVETRSNRHIWGEQYNRKLADILAMQQEISEEISGQLRLRLSGEDKKRLAT